MLTKTKGKRRGKAAYLAWRRRSMVALRWRGSWTAAPGGGAAAVRFTLSLSSLLLVSILFFFFFFCFRFWFQYSLLSLPCVLSLSLRSPLSPSVSPKKIPPSLSFGLPIYRKKTWSRYAFLSAPSITLGGSLLSVVVGARRERERRGIFSKIFRLLFC